VRYCLCTLLIQCLRELHQPESHSVDLLHAVHRRCIHLRDNRVPSLIPQLLRLMQLALVTSQSFYLASVARVFHFRHLCLVMLELLVSVNDVLALCLHEQGVQLISQLLSHTQDAAVEGWQKPSGHVNGSCRGGLTDVTDHTCCCGVPLVEVPEVLRNQLLCLRH